MTMFLTSNASRVLGDIAAKNQRNRSTLKVVFIPTASDPYDVSPWVDDDRAALLELGLRVEELDINGESKQEIDRVLDGANIIFVAGGDTFYLLKKAKESGFDESIKEQIIKGKIYIGSSAGSVIAGPNIEAVAIFDEPSESSLGDTSALGLVDFVVLPHYGKEKYGEYHHKVMAEFGREYQILPISDNQYIVQDGDRHETITVE